MADPILSTEVPANNGPDINAKNYFELENQGAFDQLANAPNGGATLQQVKNLGSLYGYNNAQRSAAQYFIDKGLGNLTLNDLRANQKNPSFIEQNGLGKAYSLSDYVKKYASADPNFDPNNASAVQAVANQVASRGLDPQKDREAVQNYISNSSVKQAIDKAQNPQNYISADQKTQDQQTAQALISQIYGNDSAQDPHLVDFLSQQLAQGAHPYELSQFLQTTPQYLQKQADAENQKVQQESLAARQALDQQLQQSQQDVFQKAAPSIISQYMKAGRLNSSGLSSALAQAQADLDQQRQGFLANAGYNDAIRAQGYNREDFVNNQSAAFNNYLRQSQPSYQQRFAVQDASNFANFQQPYNQLARQYQLNDQATQRQYQIEDYNRQQSDYFRALDQQRQAQQAALPYQLLGGVLGAGLQGWASGGFKF